MNQKQSKKTILPARGAFGGSEVWDACVCVAWFGTRKIACSTSPGPGEGVGV